MYHVFDLGSLLPPNVSGLTPTGLNDLGHIVGHYSKNGSPERRAFYFNGETLLDLGTLSEDSQQSPSPLGLGDRSPTDIAEAFGINNLGHIVGIASAPAGRRTAFKFSDGKLHDIGAFLGEFGSSGHAINDAGTVLVRAAPGLGSRTYLLNGNDAVDIGTLGGSFTYGTAINNKGEIAGYSLIEDFSPPNAFLFSEGRMVDLGRLGGAASAGNAINNSGQVVGYIDLLNGGGRRAVLFSGGVGIELGTLGGPQSNALGINDEGVIVGTSYSTSVGGVRAFVYRDGRMLDLNSLIDRTGVDFETLFEAVAINNSGQIICTSTGQKYGQTIILLTPNSSEPQAARIANFSMRARTGPADKTLILGFVVSGTPGELLLRGVGPTVKDFGLAGALENPLLTVFKANDHIIANDDWGVGQNAASVSTVSTRVGAFPLLAGSKDAAVVSSFDPGSYTFHISSLADRDGVALAEIYGAGQSPECRILNASGRAFVGVGDNVAIAGFVLEGNRPKLILIRALGQTLRDFGVTGELDDPQFVVFGSRGIVAANDDIENSPTYGTVRRATSAVGASPLRAGTKDAGTAVLLDPGAYTVVVSGKGGGTGVGLIEIYQVQ